MTRATLLLTAALLAATLGVAAAADQPGYRIGIDDVLGIAVWDNKDVDLTVAVRPDGKISLPLVGEIQAGGLTVSELIDKLNEEYGKTIKGAQVTVLVKEIRSRAVFFVGAVGKSGPLQLTQDLTVLQAVSLIGGFADRADQEGSFVLRGDKSIPIDFVKLMKGDVTQNIHLEPGDTIVVPLADAVFIQGEVKAPGAVKFVKDLTIVKAITQAGGFTPLAAPKRVTILRAEGGKKQNMRVNVEEMISNPAEKPDMPLQPNDILIVPQRLF